MPNRDVPKLQSLIRDIVLCRLVVFCDVTYTILKQTPDGSGFPTAIRSAIQALLQREAAIVFCSGDSRAVLKDQLTDRLDCGPASVYVLSAAGAEMFVDEATETGRRHRTLFQLAPVSRSALAGLLDRTLVVLHQVFGHPISLSTTERDSLLSSDGDRIQIADRIPILQEDALLEMRPMKGLTVFFPQAERATGWALRLLSALAEDNALQDLCATAGLIHSPGANFLDCCLSSKYEAAERFLTQTHEGREVASRRAIALGDSLNDRPMMRYFCRPDDIRVFVGAESEHELVTGGGPRSVYLGGNLDGSYLLLQELLRQ